MTVEFVNRLADDAGVVFGEPVSKEIIRDLDGDSLILVFEKRGWLEPRVETVTVNLGLDTSENLVPNVPGHCGIQIGVEQCIARIRLSSIGAAPQLAAVLRDDISMDTLPDGIPSSVRTLLNRCLDRDPRSRLRDIGEARIALSPESLTAGGLAAKPPPPTATEASSRR